MTGVRVRAVGHTWGGGRPALEDVSFDVEKGELVAIVGPNGAGKSTLLRVVLGFVPLQRGEVTIGGRAPSSVARRELARIAAFVPQGHEAELAFTVREMVAMGRTPHLGRIEPERAIDREAIDEAMRDTDLASLATRRFDELSGGERQRALLARAFAQRAPLLVLDEPNASLDLRHAWELLALLRKRVDGGATAIAALHDLELAARFCDRMVVLDGGRVAALGAPRDVLTPELLATVFGVVAEVERDGDAVRVRVTGVVG